MKPPDKFTFRKHASIGAAAAEEDTTFLSECFVDNGDLQPLADCKDRRRIVLGRTGAGKSALLRQLIDEKNAIVIAPETLSFNYLTNSTILQFFLEAGVKTRSVFQTLVAARVHRRIAEREIQPAHTNGKQRAPEDLIRFWMGHAKTSITDDYSKLAQDVEFRFETTEKVGTGFTVPTALIPMVPRKTKKTDLSKAA